MFHATKRRIKELEELRSSQDEQLYDLRKEIEKISQEKESKPLSKDNHERLAELEVKVAKLWGLLTEKDLRGKEKLSRMGRMFGGKL